MVYQGTMITVVDLSGTKPEKRQPKNFPYVRFTRPWVLKEVDHLERAFFLFKDLADLVAFELEAWEGIKRDRDINIPEDVADFTCDGSAPWSNWAMHRRVTCCGITSESLDDHIAQWIKRNPGRLFQYAIGVVDPFFEPILTVTGFPGYTVGMEYCF